ncbi:hypothetical protein [Kangiella taiwanensis]|uniref:Uncharacterized protein n=1 Tax=Kangiella taiwanensis TaxID=1079179 RepID=A0ABP8HXZ4_9GAMM|nr:hypothetical protein [Kangiella taiwanensis]
MNEEFRKNIAFVQTVVSLGRDLILILIAVFAVSILYFGGDPKSLTELDWAKLVGGALIVVIAPIVGYYFIALFVRFAQVALDSFHYTWKKTPKVPRGFFAFFDVGVRRMSLKEYVEKWKERRSKIQTKLDKHPEHRKYYKVLTKLLNFCLSLYRGSKFIYAFLFLIVGAYVFYNLFIQYIKQA